MPHNLHNTLQEFKLASGKTGKFYSLPALEKAGLGKISRLPVSIRIVLESVLRNCDGKKVTEEHVRAARQLEAERRAHRRDSVRRRAHRAAGLHRRAAAGRPGRHARRRRTAMGKNPKMIEPLVPVDLVVDHSVQIDHYGSKNALDLNMKLEFQRNRERYQFMKWGMQAFDTFSVVPPGIGIVHQVNLEYLARGVHKDKDGVYYPDTLVGTDSHTTMINGIGVVGWGVGGIEAEAGMLGQPVYFLTPDVVGVNLTGKLREGVTATDLVLTVTEMLRKAQGGRQVRRVLRRRHAHRCRCPTAPPSPTWRPNTARPWASSRSTRRPSPTSKAPAARQDEIDAFEAYFKAQGLFGMPQAGDIDYSQVRRARPWHAWRPAWPARSGRRTASNSAR